MQILIESESLDKILRRLCPFNPYTSSVCMSPPNFRNGSKVFIPFSPARRTLIHIPIPARCIACIILQLSDHALCFRAPIISSLFSFAPPVIATADDVSLAPQTLLSAWSTIAWKSLVSSGPDWPVLFDCHKFVCSPTAHRRFTMFFLSVEFLHPLEISFRLFNSGHFHLYLWLYSRF